MRNGIIYIKKRGTLFRNLTPFEVKLFLLNRTSITFRTLCFSLMLIVSTAYSRLNNFPRHLARKSMRVSYRFGVAYHAQGSRSQGCAGHFVSPTKTSKDSPLLPLILLSLSLSLLVSTESSYNLLFASTDFNTIGNLGIHPSLLSYPAFHFLSFVGNGARLFYKESRNYFWTRFDFPTSGIWDRERSPFSRKHDVTFVRSEDEKMYRQNDQN